jgi:hypothetical protein
MQNTVLKKNDKEKKEFKYAIRCLDDISKNGKHSGKLILVHCFGHHSDEKFVLTVALRPQVSELHLSRSRRLREQP